MFTQLYLTKVLQQKIIYVTGYFSSQINIEKYPPVADCENFKELIPWFNDLMLFYDTELGFKKMSDFVKTYIDVFALLVPESVIGSKDLKLPDVSTCSNGYIIDRILNQIAEFTKTHFPDVDAKEYYQLYLKEFNTSFYFNTKEEYKTFQRITKTLKTVEV